jgi:hypothetical protein
MFPHLPTWKHVLVSFLQQVVEETADHARLLADSSQFNRRLRAAMKSGRTVRASYLAVRHHQRRLTRRREIRRLVEGPVSANR